MSQPVDASNPLDTVPAQTMAAAAALEPAARWRLNTDFLIQAAVILALLAIWQGMSMAKIVDPFLLPTLTSVLVRIFQDAVSGSLAIDIALTFYRAAVGFGIAVVLGVPLGVLMARNRAVRWFFDPLISVGFPMPKIAFLRCSSCGSAFSTPRRSS